MERHEAGFGLRTLRRIWRKRAATIFLVLYFASSLVAVLQCMSKKASRKLYYLDSSCKCDEQKVEFPLNVTHRRYVPPILALPICKNLKVNIMTYYSISLCGATADRRGPGQRVLSYSLFGPVIKNYLSGVEGNLESVRKVYPKEYTVRVYHDKSWEEDASQVSCTKSRLVN
jgi:hypothetical protein